MHRLLPSAAATLLLLALPAVPSARDSKEEKAKKPRIAILDFPPASGGWSCSGWNQSEHRMSNVLRDLFTTEISEKSKRKVRVIERERLKDIQSELSFEQSGEVDGSSAQKIGKLLGVRYILSGKITRFACKKSEASTGWGVGALVGKVTGSGMAGAVAGSVHTAKMKFSGRIDARLIDVQTGEILGTFKDEEETSDSSVKIAGGGSQVDYDEELVNKVYEPIVERIAPKIVKKIVVVHEENLADEDEDDAPVARKKKASDDEEDAPAPKKKAKADDDDGFAGRKDATMVAAAGAGTAALGGDAAGKAKASASGGSGAVDLYANEFDFIPGDRVFFFDDFSDTDVGDSPMKFKGAGLVTVESQGRRWAAQMPPQNCGNQALRLDVKDDFPKKFTIEFDAVFGDAAYVFDVSGPGYSGQRMFGVEYSVAQVGNSRVGTLPPPGIQHVSVSVNDTYAKLYVGGKRVHQNTEGVRRPFTRLNLCMWGKSKTAAVMIANMRIAEGGKDYATELTSLGRIVTHGITFDTGSDRIRPESGPTLQKILKVLQGDPSLAFEIQGHTDNQGTDAANLPLSERRAAAVKAWLVSKAIDDGRLSTKGYGATKPLEANDSPEGRANNRRVEFVKRGG
jgi:outer membrane protein OmpA-like peptidoglycan-associated protein/curli biogenesis system outer membrane secretion channel CsgG